MLLKYIAANITWIVLLSLEAIIVIPALGYVLWGRRYRRRMILNYFTPNVIAQYFNQFFPGSIYGSEAKDYQTKFKQDPESDATRQASQLLGQRLRDLYNKRFGWISYVVSLVVLVAILAEEGTLAANFVATGLGKIIDTAAGAAPAVALATETPSEAENLTITVAAIAGAYLWIGLSIIGRCASLTLLPWDINYYSLRLLIAPMMGQAVAVLDPGRGILIAFVITMLPIGDILTWLRAGAAKALNITETPSEAADKAINLPGIDSEIAARLQEQGITTIRQLADANPTHLSMHTGLDFPFIVTLVDEAVAWGYFGPTLISLKSFGWTGASNIIDTAVALRANPDEASALSFCAANERLRAAESLLLQTPGSDPLRAQRQTDRDAAQQDVAMKQKALAASSLIDEIASVSDLKLKPEGLRNAVRAIGDDSYANFIRNLQRDIQASTMQPPAQQQPTGSLRERISSGLSNIARRVADMEATN